MRHKTPLFSVSCTLLPGEGMGYGPQGQGDVRRRLQPGGPPLGVQQSLHPQPSHRVHNGGQGGPWAGVRSEHLGFRRRPCHEGGRRQEAWQVLAWRQRRRHGHYPHSLPDPSKRHGPEAAHTPTADQYTARHADFAGYYSFIRRSLFLTYL